MFRLDAAPFTFFCPSHSAALILILTLLALAIFTTRRQPSPRLQSYMRVASLLLALNFLVWQAQLIFAGKWAFKDSLPLQLCDASHFAAMLALWRPTRLRFELLYFWGFAGATQALLTPDISKGFPDYDYFQFFITHGGIVGAAAFLAIGLGMTPRKGAVLKTFLATNLFAVLSAIANLLTGGNYFYLCHAPEAGSLLDHLGPWPWYILATEALALLLYALLDLPFRRRDRAAWPWPPASMSSKS